MSDYDSSAHNGTQEDLDSTAKFNRDELVRGWREHEGRLPHVVPAVKFAAKTDIGQIRENNEDKFDFYEPELLSVLAARGSLYAVADGVGGALAGQIASEMMLKNLISGYYDHPSPDLETALQAAISNANDRVYGLAQMIPERSGMGTTLTACVFVEDRVYVAQLGDSRAYLIRNGKIRQVTRDHSWVEEQVQAGVLSRQDAEQSPFRNVITRSIGAGPTVQPDLFLEQAQIGDVWTLCSDGLTGYVEDMEIERIAGNHAPSEAARQLIELANSRGGRDNITVFVLAVRDLIPCGPENAAPSADNSTVKDGSRPAVSHSAPPAANNAPVAPLTHSAPRSGWRKLFGL